MAPWPYRRCVFDVEVDRTRNRPSDVTRIRCRKSLADGRLDHVHPIRRCRSGPLGRGWERPPSLDAQCVHRGGSGCAHPGHLRRGGRSQSSSPCRKAIGEPKRNALPVLSARTVARSIGIRSVRRRVQVPTGPLAEVSGQLPCGSVDAGPVPSPEPSRGGGGLVRPAEPAGGGLPDSIGRLAPAH